MEIAINVRGNVHVIALSIAMILNGLRAIDKSFRFAVSVPSCRRHDIHSGSISLKEIAWNRVESIVDLKSLPPSSRYHASNRKRIFSLYFPRQSGEHISMFLRIFLWRVCNVNVEWEKRRIEWEKDTRRTDALVANGG